MTISSPHSQLGLCSLCAKAATRHRLSPLYPPSCVAHSLGTATRGCSERSGGLHRRWQEAALGGESREGTQAVGLQSSGPAREIKGCWADAGGGQTEDSSLRGRGDGDSPQKEATGSAPTLT